MRKKKRWKILGTFYPSYEKNVNLIWKQTFSYGNPHRFGLVKFHFSIYIVKLAWVCKSKQWIKLEIVPISRQCSPLIHRYRYKSLSYHKFNWQNISIVEFWIQKKLHQINTRIERLHFGCYFLFPLILSSLSSRQNLKTLHNFSLTSSISYC